jgi:hypothetical protein
MKIHQNEKYLKSNENTVMKIPCVVVFEIIDEIWALLKLQA